MSDLSTQLPQRLTRPEETGLDAGLLIPLLATAPQLMSPCHADTSIPSIVGPSAQIGAWIP